MPNPNQPRKYFDEAALEELSLSIHEKGILQPIVVRPHPEEAGKYIIIAGERRYRASKMAALDDVPVMLKNTDEQEGLELALVENLQRENINPIEEAQAYSELIEHYSYSHEELAKKLGKSRSQVANSLRLLKLPEVICHMVREGSLSNGHARALISLDDAAQQLELANRIVDEGLNVRQVEAFIKRYKQLADGDGVPEGEESPESLGLSSGKGEDPSQKWLEGQFRELFGTKVKLIQRGGKGKLVIEFYSKEELERIYALVSKSTHAKEEELYV